MPENEAPLVYAGEVVMGADVNTLVRVNLEAGDIDNIDTLSITMCGKINADSQVTYTIYNPTTEQIIKLGMELFKVANVLMDWEHKNGS